MPDRGKLYDTVDVLVDIAAGRGATRAQVARAPELIYPHWHQLANISDRLGAADLVLLGQHLRNS